MVYIIIFAIILDFILGDPYSFPHPVRLMGKIINLQEKIGRKIFSTPKGLRIGGFIIVLVNIVFSYFFVWALLNALRPYKVIYYMVSTYLAYTCLAAGSLAFEAKEVYKALGKSLGQARKRLSYIVGRDTQDLGEEDVIRACLETVSENTSDGVIAPLFYMMILGVAGGFAYKFANTMDSMLGYKDENYKDLGLAAAKFDDLVNFIPARLTGILMIISSIGKYDYKSGYRIMKRDKKAHPSPNAAYPEGALAGLLGVQLLGPSYYGGKLINKPYIGDNKSEVRGSHIKDAVRIMYGTELLLALIYIICVFVFAHLNTLP